MKYFQNRNIDNSAVNYLPKITFNDEFNGKKITIRRNGV